MHAQIVPRPFREVDTIVPCSFLDVRKRQITIFIRDVDDLIEPRDRVMHAVTDDFIGHNPTMPGNGKAAQAINAARCLEDCGHPSIVAKPRAFRQSDPIEFGQTEMLPRLL